MKNLNKITCVLFSMLLLFLVGCQDEKKEVKSIIVEGEISEDTTWNAETNYVLDGPVIVTANTKLTIEEGTIIKANPGDGRNVSMLIIARGGQLIANGTAEKPIVFTSINDNLNHLEATPSVLSDLDTGLWGGIILLGNAPISLANEETETFYIGLDPASSSSYYGGSDSDDNSGSISYVSIRHGGVFIGTGSESNGLTLCGVGSKTSINNVEIYANQDDGVEIFGGTVNISNLIVHASGDDALDIDQGYAGTVTNFLLELTEISDSGIEITGGKGDLPNSFSLLNGTINGANLTNVNAYTIDAYANGKISNLKEVNIAETVTRNNLSENVMIERATDQEEASIDFSWTKTKTN